MLIFRPVYASAQTEQNLIFQISLGMLLAPALGVVAVRWHAVMWARMLTALVLLGTNLMLWSPRFSKTISDYAGDDLQKTLIILLIVPVAAAIVAGMVLKRVIADRVVWRK